VEVVVTVQVADRGSDLQPELAGFRIGERAVEVDHVGERLAAERLHHQQGARSIEPDLVAAHDVRMGEPQEKPALAQQAQSQPPVVE
jgi:hypothetical protein